MFVVAHVAVSLDGATTGFEVDVGRYYGLAQTWQEDVTLTGADTILAQEAVLAAAPRSGPALEGPILAVVDSRYRVSAWEALRECGYWRDVVALRGRADPSTAHKVEEMVTGTDRVDMGAALAALADVHGATVVRVDSGGALIGALLRERLLDEVSLLVHPQLAGGSGGKWYGRKPPSPTTLTLIAAEPLDDGLVWLRYRVEGRR